MSRIRLVVLLCIAAFVVVVPFAHGATTNVVISQVFAGGGNAGAPYANDFVELLNRGTTPVDVTGWTVQYASAASTSWATTALGGTLQPGRYYLVQLASGGTVGVALPAPDATGTTNLAATGGKVALVRDTTALTCGATPGSCTTAEDFIGYGSATDYEGSGPAPALNGTTAAVRAGAGCTDTNVSSVDFTAAAPTPRNSSAPAASCGGIPSTSVSATAAVDVDVQPLLSISLERSAITFGSVVSGHTPPPVSERVTVVSNNAAGYALTVHRSAFTPADLPLGIAASPAGPFTAVPVAPAPDLVLATTSAPSAAAGDGWPTSVGFTGPIPVVGAGRYTATLTYTVIGR
jgi:Lamin Tail Domain